MTKRPSMRPFNLNVMNTTETKMRQTVDDILLDISWAQLSKKYFGKSRSWLNQKLNGMDSNGGSGDFNEKEKQLLKAALQDLSRRIDKCAHEIE